MKQSKRKKLNIENKKTSPWRKKGYSQKIKQVVLNADSRKKKLVSLIKHYLIL